MGLGGMSRSRFQSSPLPLAKSSSMSGILFVIVFVLMLGGGMEFGLQGVNGETMRWRYPGVSGRWLDPHNWIGSTSKLPRVPGPNDDVILSDYNIVYGSQYVVTLEVRSVHPSSLLRV